MKKTVSIPPVLVALSVASGCAAIEQVADRPDDIEDCRMEPAIGSHIKEEECDPNNDPGRDSNGIFGEIIAEQTDRMSRLPEGKCGSE